MSAFKDRLARAAAFVFDVDGTLLDSHPGHWRAWDRTTRAYGRSYSREEIEAHFGKTTGAIADALLPHLDPAERARAGQRKAEFFLEEVSSLSPFPGATEALAACKRSGRRACLASSNVRRVIVRVVEAFGWAGLVDALVGLEDVERGKPDPEVVLVAARKLGVTPDRCVVVGDSAYDVESAKAAGAVVVVGVLTGVHDRERLAAAGADVVLDSVADLVPLASGLPPV